MDRLTDLELTGRADDAFIPVEPKARRVPLKPQKVDQAAGLEFDVANELAVRDVKPLERLGLTPVAKNSPMFGKSARDVFAIVGPGNRRKVGLPA